MLFQKLNNQLLTKRVKIFHYPKFNPLMPRVKKSSAFFGDGAAPATDPKECLNSLTEVTYRVQSVKVFCHIKIIYLKGDILQSNAFHNIWQQVPPPPPLTSHITSVDK